MHMNISYEVTQVSEMVKNTATEVQLKSCEDLIIATKNQINELNVVIAHWKSDEEVIDECMAIFASFLKANAIIPSMMPIKITRKNTSE